MKRKIEIVFITALSLAGIATIILTGRRADSPRSGFDPYQDSITLRNLTEDVVTYRIDAPRSTEPAQDQRLEPRRLVSIPSRRPLDLEFERQGRRMTFQILPGKNYTFRYDQHDRVNIYLGSHGLADAEDLAPFLPTPMVVVRKMLALADLDKQDLLYDLGCGDGRIVIEAADRYGARGIGIDIDPQRIRESRAWAKLVGVEGLVEFRVGDVTEEDISRATVVTIYLLPESNALLRPQLEEQLKPGTIVVSHNYRIPGWEDIQIDDAEVEDVNGREHRIFVYRR